VRQAKIATHWLIRCDTVIVGIMGLSEQSVNQLPPWLFPH